MRPLLLLLAAVRLVAAAAAIPGQAEIDAYVQQTMREMKIPGAAVGIIRDGKVVLAKGYGLRDMGRNLPATADTLFAIGSVSKSFTAVGVGLMVDEKKLSWDTPVREYLPWFRMFDPVASELITPRDLLTHRSGLPRHDFIRFSTPLSREELVRRIRYLPNSTSFREKYQYNNLMYVTAGYLSGVVAGATWEDLMRERIFKPLGMTKSTVTVADSQKAADFAKPHDQAGDSYKEVDFYDYQKFGVGPNGAVNSSANDLLKYLQFYMDDNQRLLSKASREELWKPVVVAGDGTYALGWSIYNHRGHRAVGHSGGITGFTAYALILPDDKIGIIVLNNAASGFPYMAAEGLADRMLGVPTPARQLRNASGGGASGPQRVPNTKPSLPLSALGGEYTHPAYGVIRVEAAGDQLRVTFAALTTTLKHFHYDTWEFGDERGLAQFRLDTRGRVETLLLPLEPTVPPLEFRKLNP